MVRLIDCPICDASHSAMREHCPVCGSRRKFLAGHSYEPTRVIVTACDALDLGREVVRAIRTNVGYSVNAHIGA